MNETEEGDSLLFAPDMIPVLPLTLLLTIVWSESQ